MRAALLVGVAFVAACSSAQRSDPGAKVVVAPPTSDSEAPRKLATTPPAWLAEALAWEPLTSEPVRSSHFATETLAEIRVNPEARATYLALVTDSAFPVGTRIVETHRDARTSRLAPTFVLTRSATDWEFSVLDSAGLPLTDATLGHCSGCHAGATAAPVFGLERARDARN